MHRAITLLAVIVFAAACASSSAPRRPAVSSDIITAEEIAQSSATNAYDLVNRLRPRWLQPARTTSSIGGGVVRQPTTLVYLDGARLGGLDALRSLSVFSVRQVQWYDAQRAATTLRDIPNQPIAGAIVVTTRTQ
jgi:hypothetical protein